MTQEFFFLCDLEGILIPWRPCSLSKWNQVENFLETLGHLSNAIVLLVQKNPYYTKHFKIFCRFFTTVCLQYLSLGARHQQNRYGWLVFISLESLWEDWGDTDHGKCSCAKCRGCAGLGTQPSNEGMAAVCGNVPNTQEWQNLNRQRHQWGEQAQVPMPQCSLCCQTAPHLVPYLV